MTEFLELYLKQADGEDLLNIGQSFRCGTHGRPVNLHKAFECFEAAANKNFRPAYQLLGQMYLYSEGTPPHISYLERLTRAADFLLLAAEDGADTEVLIEAYEAINQRVLSDVKTRFNRAVVEQRNPAELAAVQDRIYRFLHQRHVETITAASPAPDMGA